MRSSWSVAVVVLLCSFVAIPSWANHDDSTLVGLRVTVGSVNPTTGDVTITVTGSDDFSSGQSTYLSNAYLGTVFAYDGYSSTLLTPSIPAIDWGDGATIGNAKLPFSTELSATHNGNSLARYKAQFAHTYGAPGVYTIKAFGINVYGEAQTPVYGNEVTAATWRARTFDSGTTTFESTPDGVSATAAVTIGAVPTMQRTGLALLALVLAMTGAALLLRRN